MVDYGTNEFHNSHPNNNINSLVSYTISSYDKYVKELAMIRDFHTFVLETGLIALLTVKNIKYFNFYPSF